MIVYFAIDLKRAAFLDLPVDRSMSNTSTSVVGESFHAWEAKLCISLLIGSDAI